MFLDMRSQAFQDRVTEPRQSVGEISGHQEVDVHKIRVTTFQNIALYATCFLYPVSLVESKYQSCWLACVVWLNTKLDELSTSKYLPFPKELCELTMTLSRYISKIHLRVREVQTNILTATRQFDGCELLFVVFLERRAKLGYEVGAFDSESFDIYCNIFRIKGPALGVVFVPAMTSASLRFVSSCLEHCKGLDVLLLGALLPRMQTLWRVGKPFEIELGRVDFATAPKAQFRGGPVHLEDETGRS
jgi:hypothetical protein